MYKKILVPLDGSELAECVFPHVRELLTGCDACEVILLNVIEPIHTGGIDSYIDFDAITDALVSQAESYLVEARARLPEPGWSIRAEIKKGKAASTIVDYAEENGVDLIAIATHGRSGISRWINGSVAKKVVDTASVPVLLIRPSACELDVSESKA